MALFAVIRLEYKLSWYHSGNTSGAVGSKFSYTWSFVMTRSVANFDTLFSGIFATLFGERSIV